MTEIEKTIRAAFAETPIPSGKLTDTYDDEGVSDYFKGSHWDGHSAEKLRYHSCALSFFEPAAFRYYLPAFMIAEIQDPETADIIAENIAYKFDTGHIRAELLPEFEDKEIDAILAFMRECANRYADGIYDALFLKAAAMIEKDRSEQDAPHRRGSAAGASAPRR